MNGKLSYQLINNFVLWGNHAGIRSFGTADGDKAVIQFGTPLTLITGQNGAGKTVL